MSNSTGEFKEYHHAHHWDNAHDEFEASKQGMWVFMVTEVLMFGGLFVAYAIFKGMYPEMFKAAHTLLDWKLGALNTLVLISSSVTMALAVNSAQTGQKKKTGNYLLATIFFAACFMVVKYFEYSHKFHIGVFPGGNFNCTVEECAVLTAHPKAPIFFSLYFMMTGLHGFHVLVGMGVIFWIWLRNRSGEISPQFFTPVELTGFYWHFVDLVWIYLFPLLYLIG